MKAPLLGSLFLFLSLVGCASKPVPVNYYALVPSVSAADELVQRADKPTLIIERVDLAEYLQQSGMVIQTGSNQLQISRTNLWAESLELALPKALIRELQQQSGDYSYYLKSMDWVHSIDFRIRIRLDSLHATDRGEVVASGRYQLISEHGSKSNVFADFNFHRDLDQDGYAHTVEQIQAILSQIAGAIVGSLDELASH